MAEIDSIVLNMGVETKNAEVVKLAVLERLLKEKVINEEQFDTYSTKWNVIIIKRNWFSKWVNRFSKEDKDGYQYKFVKFED